MSVRPARVEELFHAALARPKGARAAFVCAQPDDLAVREDVLSLLVHADADSGEDVIDRHVPSQPEDAPDDTLPPGTEVGGFRILARLGQGGMGVVYRATRAQGDATQVALKLLRWGTDDPAAVARFAREGRVLARLAHRGIAAFVEAGVDATRGPFVVMEVVPGLPITEHCDRRRLDLRARLDLFCEVCEAVQAAHACGVVHRDLKPSNVLVTLGGQPKLVDFGVAKLLRSHPDHGWSTSTWPPAPLTPGYASPEQFCGQVAGPASDVFALGVLLGELLCGADYVSARGRRRRPSDVVARSPAREALAAARACTSGRLRWRLRGDLDAIVQAATEADPEARPPSAAELAAEVRRHLAGERPRVARRTQRGPRGRVLALAAVVLVAVAWGLRQQAARAVPPNGEVGLLEPLLEEADDRLADAGGTLEQRALPLRGVVQRLDRLLDDGEGRGRDMLRALAFSHERVASLEGHTRRANLGRPDVAQAHYRRALVLRARVVQTDRSPRAAREWVDALVAYGTLMLDAFHDLGRSRAALEPAVRMASSASALDRSADMAVSLTRARVRLADLEQRSGRRAAARQQLEAISNDLARGLDGRASLELRFKLSGALARRGWLEATWGDPAAALPWLQAHCEQMRALGAGDSTSPLRLRWADVLGNPEVPNLGRVAEARDAYRVTLEYCDAALRSDPSDARLREECHGARLHDAQTLVSSAPHAALRVARALERALGASATDTDRGPARLQLAAAHALAARSLSALGQHDAARGRWQRASTVLAELVRDPDDSEVLQPLAGALEGLGVLEARTGQRGAARDALAAALRVAERLWRLDPTPASGLQLARLHWHCARLEPHPQAPAASAHLAAALATLRAVPGPCSGSTQREREALGLGIARWQGTS